MSTWECSACTFLNQKQTATVCEICQTSRSQGAGGGLPNPPKQNKTTSKTTRQATLFGGLADVTTKSKKEPLKEKKPAALSRSMKTSSTGKTEMIAFASKTSQNHSLVSSRTLQNVPFQTLWERSETIMREVFGISKLRFLQPQAVRCALHRQSQIIVMATGGGKSLCYQLPAMVMGGTTIVVSPLKALISDQVSALLKKGIEAAFVSSQLSEGNKTDLFERLLRRPLRAPKKKAPQVDYTKQPTVSLLYCTPEQIKTQRFREVLTELHEKKRLSGFAIDEAHSISEWGHDFRPAYMDLIWLRKSFPDVPLMACTATATKKVLDDITKALQLQDRPCHIGSFDRPNITYHVRYKEALEISNPNGGAIGDLIKFLKSQHMNNCEVDESVPRGIVYVHKKQDTELLARQITKDAGIIATAYHGGMKDLERADVQENWMSGKSPIAVATIAFGMGIDCASVRYVVHWNISKTIENIYQEMGRAGRDGLPSSSLVYFSNGDASLFRFLATKKKNGEERALEALEKVAEYCLTQGCRRAYLLRFFGEKVANSASVCQKNCDYCQNPTKVSRAIEASNACNDFSFQTTMSSGKEWDGQWAAPHGDYSDDDDYEERGELESNGLIIRGSSDATEDSRPVGKNGSIEKVLKKYEKLESNDDKQTGFVRYRSRDRDDGKIEIEEIKAHQPVVIPAHLRKNAPDPLQHFEKKPADKKQSSDDIAADASRLREELEKMKAARAKLLSKSKGATKAAAPPPPPPPMVRPSKRRRH